MKLIVQILAISLSLIGAFTTISNRLPYIKDVLGKVNPSWSRIKGTIKALNRISAIEDLKKEIDEGHVNTSDDLEVNIEDKQHSGWIIRRNINEKNPGFKDFNKMINKHYLIAKKISNPRKISYGYIFYEDWNSRSAPFLSFLNWLKNPSTFRKEEITKEEEEMLKIYDRWLKEEWALYDSTMMLSLSLGKPVIPSDEKVIYYDSKTVAINPNLDQIFDQYKNDILLFWGFILIFASFILQGIILFLK